MTVVHTVRGAAAAIRPITAAMHMNLTGAIQARRRGYRGWVGAVNTDYDPLDPATAAQPFAAYRALHSTGRVHYNPARATWILSKLDDIRTALRNTDAITSSQGVTRIRMTGDVVVLTDGERHTELRKQVQPGFSRKALDDWQSITEEIATDLVTDALADRGGDIVQRLAVPMPLLLIARILGIPDTDIDDFRHWSEDAVRIIDFSPTPVGITGTVRSIRAVTALRRYIRQQLASGTLKGSNTILGRLLEHSTEEKLTDEGLFYIAMLLLIAGNETTTNLLGGMFDTLARNPDQYDLIRSDPTLIPMAVEEQLRISSPIQNLYRYTRSDHRVGDITIPSGSRILISFGAANRDPAVFDNPDEYRVHRNPRAHMAFGHGPHACLGAPLARMEAHAVLHQLVTRVDRITATGPTTWSTNSSLRGPTHLPIRLTPSQPRADL